MIRTRQCHDPKTLAEAGRKGLANGWEGFLWILKIVVPISFLIMFLKASGLIGILDVILEPAMGFLHLPATASLALMAGMMTGTLGGIAVMNLLPFTDGEMTLIALFLLISHNLIQEGIIQWKSGFHFLPATLSRVTASVVTVLMMAFFIRPAISTAASLGVLNEGTKSWMATLQDWFFSTACLCAKIFVIIMGMMLLLEILKELGLIEHVAGLLKPLLMIMGLDQRVGVLWLLAAVFGLGFGGVAIIQQSREAALEINELKKLHMSIGINHAMIDEPVMFLSVGVNPFWLWIPRLIAAIASVWVYLAWLKLKSHMCMDNAGLNK